MRSHGSSLHLRKTKKFNLSIGFSFHHYTCKSAGRPVLTAQLFHRLHFRNGIHVIPSKFDRLSCTRHDPKSGERIWCHLESWLHFSKNCVCHRFTKETGTIFNPSVITFFERLPSRSDSIQCKKQYALLYLLGPFIFFSFRRQIPIYFNFKVWL